MVPAQPSADVDTESLYYTSTASPGNSIPGTVFKDGLRCISNIEDTKSLMEPAISRQVEMKLEDVEVDVTGCSNLDSVRGSDSQDPDATEYSSSFGGTVSDSENCSGFSEAEVESQFDRDIGLVPAFDAIHNMLPIRKRKLTDHWKNFIRPLMWRCKWTELRIKEIESRAMRYARALSFYEQSMNPTTDDPRQEAVGSKSQPLPFRPRNRKIMKRRKRKRVEDTMDTSSYMSHHHLFSYFDNKKSDQEATFMPDDVGNSDKIKIESNECGGNYDATPPKFGETDKALEEMLQKIEVVNARVNKLRSQVDVIMSQNAAKFSSSENLSLLDPSPTLSEDVKSVGPVYPPSQHMLLPGYDMDSLLPESVVSSFGEAVSVPDVIESTVGLLSASDVTLHPPFLGDTKEGLSIVDSVLIHNEVVEGESHVLSRSNTETNLKNAESGKGEQDESPDPSPNIEPKPEPVLLDNNIAAPQHQPNLQSGLASDIHVPMSKRKRGERKCGVGGWNKKGELDSQ